MPVSWMRSHPWEEMMPVTCTVSSLMRVGVTLLSSDPMELRCNHCGTVWQPGRLASGRLPQGWWKCPTDPRHTVDWDAIGTYPPPVEQMPGTSKLRRKTSS